MNTDQSPSMNSNASKPTSVPISNVRVLYQQSMSHVPDVPTVPRSKTSKATNIPTASVQHNHTSLHSKHNISCPECPRRTDSPTTYPATTIQITIIHSHFEHETCPECLKQPTYISTVPLQIRSRTRIIVRAGAGLSGVGTLGSPSKKHTIASLCLASQPQIVVEPVPDVPTVPRSQTSSTPKIPTSRTQHNHTSLHTNLNVPCPECLNQPTSLLTLLDSSPSS